MQLIICVETDSKCNSDYLYISTLIKEHYNVSEPPAKLTPVYLKGKSQYCHKDWAILQYKKKFRGPSIVIMCLDTDQGLEGETMNQKITSFCIEQGYFLVWMNRDIEEVFLKRRISKGTKAKQKEAERFARLNLMASLNLIDLEKQLPLTKEGTSNLLTILDLFLNKKK